MENSTNTAINILLKNQTGLDDSQYSIYVLGYSTASQQMLSVTAGTTAAFVAVPNQSGNLPTYKLGTDITEISVSTAAPLQAINGARIYFFVADNSTFPSAPQVPYSNSGAAVTNVLNPPNSAVPPYTFVEFTLIDLQYGPVIDVQTVDGFIFPITISLNDFLGAVGQPLTGLDRNAILAAYAPFMHGLGGEGVAFLDLHYDTNSGGLVNPYLYLLETNTSNEFKNLGSQLNTLFDNELATLFANQNLSIQGVGSGSINADIYTVQSTGAQTLPSGLSQPALQFVGQSNGVVLDVFSPLGLCTLTYNKNGTNTPISGQLDNTTLTFDNPLPADTNILVGMYVVGAGVDPGSTTVTSISTNAAGNITGVVVSGQLTGKPAASQYGFSKIPNMFMTSGAMVFANAGVFAYTNYSGDELAVVLNLQNQLVTALNRGVANAAPNSGSPGYSSAYWGTQTNWYPLNVAQNLFSLFMHTGLTGRTPVPIFIQAPGSTTCARGTTMGQTYGFAYDEDAGPVPPAPANQPNVPSEFNPLPAGANVVTITLGSWNDK